MADDDDGRGAMMRSNKFRETLDVVSKRYGQMARQTEEKATVAVTTNRPKKKHGLFSPSIAFDLMLIAAITAGSAFLWYRWKKEEDKKKKKEEEDDK